MHILQKRVIQIPRQKVNLIMQNLRKGLKGQIISYQALSSPSEDNNQLPKIRKE